MKKYLIILLTLIVSYNVYSQNKGGFLGKKFTVDVTSDISTNWIGAILADGYGRFFNSMMKYAPRVGFGYAISNRIEIAVHYANIIQSTPYNYEGLEDNGYGYLSSYYGNTIVKSTTHHIGVSANFYLKKYAAPQGVYLPLELGYRISKINKKEISRLDDLAVKETNASYYNENQQTKDWTQTQNSIYVGSGVIYKRFISSMVYFQMGFKYGLEIPTNLNYLPIYFDNLFSGLIEYNLGFGIAF